VTLAKTTGRPGLADAVQVSGAGGGALAAAAAAEDVTVAGAVVTLAVVFPPEVQPARTPAARTPVTVNASFIPRIVTQVTPPVDTYRDANLTEWDVVYKAAVVEGPVTELTPSGIWRS
jgi:hypothetical protein